MVAGAALHMTGAGNRSIDCAARVPAAGTRPTATMEQVKQLLQDMPANCDYNVNDRTKPEALWACKRT